MQISFADVLASLVCEWGERQVPMLLARKDVSKLLECLPKGVWVALSADEERVVAYAADLQQALQKAHEADEKDPVMIRIPESGAATLLL